MCNELFFLKQKLDFLYSSFDQLIFVDYDILNNRNSNDGSIQFIEEFNDVENKITLVKFGTKDLNEIKVFNGVSMIEKRKMFAKGSKFIKGDIDIIWATDMDEFFDKSLIRTTETIYENDSSIVTLDYPQLVFVYNQYNIFSGGERNNSMFLCPPRITKYQKKNKIYGHCNFKSYGKTVRSDKGLIYHFAYVGVQRLISKFAIYSRSSNSATKKRQLLWLRRYVDALKRSEKFVQVPHPNEALMLKSIPFSNELPTYINVGLMIKGLNKL